MAVKIIVIVVLTLAKSLTAQMEGYIVGGNYTKIQYFAHSVLVSVECPASDGLEYIYTCGGSVVNQVLVLTAAHCLDYCSKGTETLVQVGHEIANKGQIARVEKYVMHHQYDPAVCDNDIMLLRVKERFRLGSTVRRVSLMSNPPKETSMATVAGWGVVNEITEEGTDRLKFTSQEVFSRTRCQTLLPNVPVGAFCAGVQNDKSYASKGDSGSALIVKDYIQIGLVSFKAPHISRSVVIYTDIGYFFDWIQRRAKTLYCSTSK